MRKVQRHDMIAHYQHISLDNRCGTRSCLTSYLGPSSVFLDLNHWPAYTMQSTGKRAYR